MNKRTMNYFNDEYEDMIIPSYTIYIYYIFKWKKKRFPFQEWRKN